MERIDWLDAEFSPQEAQLLLVTAITHHRLGSKLWGDGEVDKLLAELAAIDGVGEALIGEHELARASSGRVETSAAPPERWEVRDR